MSTSSTITATKLQELLEADLSLAQSLAQGQNLDQAVVLIMAVADRHGLAMNADELKAYLKSQVDAAMTELSDEQLAGMAGGISVRLFYFDIKIDLLGLLPY